MLEKGELLAHITETSKVSWLQAQLDLGQKWGHEDDLCILAPGSLCFQTGFFI